MQPIVGDKRLSGAVKYIFDVVEQWRPQTRTIGFDKAYNSKYGIKSLTRTLLLLPLLSFRSVSDAMFGNSDRFVSCHKDTFYRTLSANTIDWRKINYSLVRFLLKKRAESATQTGKRPTCLIVDDTDFPKRGLHSELLGKVYSHLAHKQIIGYKALTLTMCDGASQFVLDFTLQGEHSSNGKHGLTDEQIGARFQSEMGDDTPAAKRAAEYFESKIENAKKMVKRATIEGVKFDYLLFDSWFMCESIIEFVKGMHQKCHVLGMVKAGKTKYRIGGKDKTFSMIVNQIHRPSKLRGTEVYHYSTDAKLSGTNVRLHFYRFGKRGAWKALLTTDLSLNARAAYELYATRWTIEVTFKDCKQLLGLGKCQCRHFASQVASASLCFMQYNILSLARRVKSYETLGGLLREAQDNVAELSVYEKTIQIIFELVRVIAETLGCDADDLMRDVAT